MTVNKQVGSTRENAKKKIEEIYFLFIFSLNV
jgi:hypothetical protein